MKNFFASRLRWLLVIPAFFLLLYFVIYFVLFSSAFSRYAVSKVEEGVADLKISNVQGSFSRGLQFDLQYLVSGADIRSENTRIKITPACLLRASLCVQSIEIEKLQITLITTESDKDSAPIELPEISMPIRVAVERLSIKELEITQDGEDLYQAQKINLAAVLQGNDFDLLDFTSIDNFCSWNISAGLALRQQYPLSANVACDASDRFGRLSLILSGDLALLKGRVNAQVMAELFEGYIQDSVKASLSFNLEPLNPNLLLNAQLRVDEPVTVLSGENSFLVSKASLNIDGPALSPALNVDATFDSSMWTGSNDLNAHVEFAGDSLNISELHLRLPKGQITALGELKFSEDLHWQGEISWQDVDITQWQTAATGIISGRIINEVQFDNEQISVAINLDRFSGDLMGEPLSGSGQLLWQDEKLSIEQLLIQQDKNTLIAKGVFSPTQSSDLTIDMDFSELNNIISDAQGALVGSIRLTGNLDNIFIVGQLDANRLAYDNLKIANASTHFNWYGISQRDGDFSLSVNSLEIAQRGYGNAQLSWQGNIDRHRLSLSFTGTDEFDQVAVLLECEGGFNTTQTTAFEQWSGECGKLNTDYMFAEELHRWSLASAIGIDVEVPAKSIRLSDFCFSYETARICSDSPTQFASGDINNLVLNGSGFQIEWLKSFIDTEIELAGDWGFSFTGSQLLTAPSALAKIGSDEIKVVWKRKNEAPVNLEITQVDANWSLQNSQHRLNWNLSSKSSGTSTGELNLNGKDIRGRAKITALQLSDYSRFIFPNPGDNLAGQVDADVSIAGNLELPLINGEISLQKGEFTSNTLPVPLSAIEMKLAVQNSSAKVNGSFQALEGNGEIDGVFEWQQDTWSGELGLKAEDFTLKPDANSIVRVSPDLVFKMSPQHLVLSGQVLVPMARILIKELPEQAVSTSPDVVIVGQENSSTERTISTKLAVKLGNDVRFVGFGLETGLKGELNIHQENGGILRGDGVVQLSGGRYKAYGQNLKINSGDLIFVSDIENPQIRLEAIRDSINSDIVVGLRASGAASKPDITLFSRPELSDQEKFSYLLTGNPPGYDDGSEFDPTQAAAEAALSYALESNTGLSMTRRAAERFGIKDLKIATSSGDDGTQIGLSGYLTPNLMVRYGVGVFDAVNTLTLDYRLRKNLTLEAVSGESSALDLLWSFERD